MGRGEDEDVFAYDKLWAYEKLIKEKNASWLTFDMRETTLESHEARKDWFCYFCDKPIGDYYYSHYRSDSWYRRKLCPHCVARMVDFFRIDLEKYEKIRHEIMIKAAERFE